MTDSNFTLNYAKKFPLLPASLCIIIFVAFFRLIFISPISSDKSAALNTFFSSHEVGQAKNNLEKAFAARKQQETPTLDLERLILVYLWENKNYAEFRARAQAYLMVEKDPIVESLLEFSQRNSDRQNLSLPIFEELWIYSYLHHSWLNRVSWIIIMLAFLSAIFSSTRLWRYHQKTTNPVFKKLIAAPLPTKFLPDLRNSFTPEKTEQKLSKSRSYRENFAPDLATPPVNFATLRETCCNKLDSPSILKSEISHFQKEFSYSNESLATKTISVNCFSHLPAKLLQPEFMANNPLYKFYLLQGDFLPTIVNTGFYDASDVLPDKPTPPKKLLPEPAIAQEPVAKIIKKGKKELARVDSKPLFVPTRFDPLAFSNSAFEEELENLSALVKALELVDAEKKILGITSCSSISNQATFTANLGKTLGRMKNRTLLIDLNFNDPKLNQLTDGPCIYSIKDYLKVNQADGSFFVKSIIDNVFILHTGLIEEAVLEKINNERFWHRVIADTTKQFDKVLLRLPDLNHLAKLSLQAEAITYLVLFNEDSTRSKFELVDAWIPLKRYDLKSFLALKCFVSRDS